ncbi:MAG: type II secretion system F family protein [Patescibacteria group bacterium]
MDIGRIFNHISISEKMLFTKHLSIMIRSGMPLLDSLWMLRRQSKSKTFQKIISQLIVDVDNGQFLSVSLDKQKSIFGNFFINIIRVGEASGTLADNLNYLHEELKKGYELRRKVKAAMTYPFIVLVATVGISSILLFVVFPQIMPIFDSFKVQLPITTRILIATVNFFLHYGWLVGIGIIILVFAISFLLRLRAVKFLWHKFILLIPFIGQTSVNVNMTAFARTLASLLKSGIKIVDALNITAETMPNIVYRVELKNVSETIRKGETMSNYLLANEKYFPPTFSQMIEVGESTGHLDENLAYLAEFYGAEVDEQFKNLSTILEPLLILFMGILVGFVVLSIITPIYTLTQNLKVR